jgi:hypothetical protein
MFLELRAWRKRRATEHAMMAEAVFVGSRADSHAALSRWTDAVQGIDRSLGPREAAMAIAASLPQGSARPWSDYYSKEVH